MLDAYQKIDRNQKNNKFICLYDICSLIYLHIYSY